VADHLRLDGDLHERSPVPNADDIIDEFRQYNHRREIGSHDRRANTGFSFDFFAGCPQFRDEGDLGDTKCAGDETATAGPKEFDAVWDL
jgi:hypothetical protein